MEKPPESPGLRSLSSTYLGDLVFKGINVELSSLAQVLKAIGRPVETACKLLENLLGEPFKIGGDALADQVKFWQWRNRIRILERASEIMRDREIDERKLDPGFFLPFVEGSGQASDETLQEAWARLLVAAIEDDTHEHISFVNLLRSLTPLDVKVLDVMIRLGYLPREERAERIASELSIARRKVDLSIGNFDHLGFFSPTHRKLKGFAVHFLRLCVADGESLDLYLKGQEASKGHMVMD